MTIAEKTTNSFSFSPQRKYQNKISWEINITSECVEPDQGNIAIVVDKAKQEQCLVVKA